MEHSYFLLFLLFLIILADRDKKRKIAAVINRRANQRELLKMKSLAEKFIGRECMIHTLTTSCLEPIKGTIEEITDNGLLLNNKGKLQAINLEYVTQIQECSKNKKGKK